MTYSVPNRDLFEILFKNKNADRKERIELLVNYLCVECVLPQKCKSELRTKISTGFLNNFEKKFAKLKQMNKGFKDFFGKYENWLDCDFKFSCDITDEDDVLYEPSKQTLRNKIQLL